MITIEIDNEVFAFLQKNARPFVDTPNSTLRRLHNIDNIPNETRSTEMSSTVDNGLEELIAESSLAALTRSKAPKADLKILVQRGLLRNGQMLHLVDYQANNIKQTSAVISGGDLIYNELRYSMSNLAQELLAKVGFTSKSVRGPNHWVTDDGKSIKDLWQKYLDQTNKK